VTQQAYPPKTTTSFRDRQRQKTERDLQLMQLAAELIRSSHASGVKPRDLATLIAGLPPDLFELGEYIYVEGDPAEHFHFLIDGTVRVLVGDDERELIQLRAPAILGHLGVLTGLPRSATVQACGDARLARMSHRELWRVVASDDPAAQGLRRMLLASMSQLISQTNQRLVDLAPRHGRRVATNPKKDQPRVKQQTAKEVVSALADTFDPDLCAQAQGEPPAGVDLNRPGLASEYHRASRERHYDRRPHLNPLGRIRYHRGMNQRVTADLRDCEPIKPQGLGPLSGLSQPGPVGFAVERIDSHSISSITTWACNSGDLRFLYAALRK